MNILTIDFESKDPYIGQGYGAGWVYALRGYENPEFKLLGASIKFNDGHTSYVTNLQEVANFVLKSDILVMHSAQYDIGCLLVLFKQLGIEWANYKDIAIHDTMIMAKLVDQNQFSYSLENCSKRYGGTEKSKQTLTDYVWISGLYQLWYKDNYEVNKKTRPKEDDLFDFAITHLDQIPQEIVEEYCNFDVEATYDLYQVLKQKIDKFPEEFDLNLFSTVTKACVDMKARGVRIDVDMAKANITKLQSKIDTLLKEIYEEVGYEFNIDSSAQVVNALKRVGISEFSTTAKGNEGANKKWLEQQPYEICKKIIKTRNYEKIIHDFLIKLLESQDIHRQNGSDDCRVFPNFNILGATKTGRMSSSALKKARKKTERNYELNFQQIPKRGEDEDAARLVRAVFIADEGEKWISADYSNQEQRLQVDFARLLKLDGAQVPLQELKNNPYTDFHQMVADICGIGRSEAKTINLGLSYSLGQAKLCKSLGLPTKWVFSKRFGRDIEVADIEGKLILDKYHEFLGFMKELQQKAADSLLRYGYVKTLAGRKLYQDPPKFEEGRVQKYEYKGLSKIIQGSGADMIYKAIANCYEKGLKLLLPVHDELNISSGNSERDVVLLKECMENTYSRIEVPMVTEITIGDNWAGD